MFHRLSGERGSALMAVIGVMAVLMIVTLTVTGSSLQALSVTNSTRAGVQAQAAAEAGIDFAIANMGTREACPQAPMESAAAPIFTASILYLAVDGSEVDCAEAVRVKIVSTGTAVNPGRADTSTGDNRTVEAVFEFGGAGAEPQASNAAIYSYLAGTFDHSTEFSAADPLPMIQVRTGDPSCAEAANASAASSPTFDLVIAEGGMSVGDSCELLANVWASGKIDLASSARIHGNALANGLRLTSSSRILGDAWATENTTLDGGSSVIEGHLVTKTFTGNPEGVKGDIDYHGSATAPAAPATPVVSDWVSVGQSEGKWSAFGKASLLPAGNNNKCGTAELKAALEGVTQPTVVDALACKFGLTLDAPIGLPADLVILAKGFDLLQPIAPEPSAGNVKLWLITPDNPDMPDHGACNGNADGKLAHSSIGDIEWNGKVSAMLHTPCRITLGEGASWRGQLYGGSVHTGKNSKLEYAYVGLPGDENFASADGGASESDSGRTHAGLGKQLSVRDRNDRE